MGNMLLLAMSELCSLYKQSLYNFFLVIYYCIFDKFSPELKSITELKQVLQVIWENLLQGPINKAVKNFNKRLNACESAGSGHFKYSQQLANCLLWFFCERIINVWNSLPSTVNFGSLNCFKQSIGSVDFSVFLKCS